MLPRVPDPRGYVFQRLDGALRSQLKIFQRAGRKYAVRLESIYWSQLSDFAKEDGRKLSELVLDVFEQVSGSRNKTGALRCYCLDRMRRQMAPRGLQQGFDLLTLIAACPSPVAIITREHRLLAFNPAFSELVTSMSGAPSSQNRAIKLSYSEPLPKIVRALLDFPKEIRTYQVGVQIGVEKAKFFRARFSLTDSAKGEESQIVVYLY